MTWRLKIEIPYINIVNCNKFQRVQLFYNSEGLPRSRDEILKKTYKKLMEIQFQFICNNEKKKPLEDYLTVNKFKLKGEIKKRGEK